MNDCSISEGRSGAFFVKTRNRRYIIKFVRKSEYQVLQDILQDLAMHFIHPHEEGSYAYDLQTDPMLPEDFHQISATPATPATVPATPATIGHKRKPSNLSASNSVRQPPYGGYLAQSTPRSVASQHSRHVTPIVPMPIEDSCRIYSHLYLYLYLLTLVIFSEFAFFSISNR